MIQLIVLMSLVLIAVLTVRELLQAKQQLSRSGRRVLVWSALLLLGYVAITGRLGLIVPIIGAVIVALLRLLPVLLPFFPILHRLWRQHAAQQGANPADRNRSTVESKYLRMHLDHRTGDIRGAVLLGPFAGRDLQSMTRDELVQLYGDCVRHDHDSAVLLEAYLDRVHGTEWRAGARSANSPPRGAGAMTTDEAYDILGLTPGASRDAIIQAHRRLMQKLHPDRGGSDYLAAKINRAKQVLLGG